MVVIFTYIIFCCRCGQIMGRSDEEELTAAQIFYPCMQCADVFFLKVLPFSLLVCE